MLDDTDIAILEHIQQDGRMSNSKLAEKVNLSERRPHVSAVGNAWKRRVTSMVTPLSWIVKLGTFMLQALR